MAARPSSPVSTSVPGGSAVGQCRGQVGVADGHDLGSQAAGPGRPAASTDRHAAESHDAEPVRARPSITSDGLGADRSRRPHEADRDRLARSPLAPRHRRGPFPHLTRGGALGPGRTSPAGRRAGRRPGRAHRRGPGRSDPMSFSPRSRLISDSHRSPTGATTATTRPEEGRLGRRPGMDLPGDGGRGQRWPPRCRRSGLPRSCGGSPSAPGGCRPSQLPISQGAHVGPDGGHDRPEEEGDAVAVGELAGRQQQSRRTSPGRPTQTKPSSGGGDTRPPVDPRSTPTRYHTMEVTISEDQDEGQGGERPWRRRPP